MSPFPLRLQSLHLTNFRSYPSLRLSFDERFAVFTGPNGAGKTNILEAISFLNPGRGFSRSKLVDIVHSPALPKMHVSNASWKSLGWGVASEFETQDGTRQLATGWNGGEDENTTDRRLIRIDGKDTPSQNAFERVLTILWLIPAMDRLLIEGPGARRKFLDKLVSSLDPDHSRRIYRYEHALRERSRLLRDGRKEQAWFSVLEETMANEGLAITVARQETLEILATSMQAHESAFPRAQMTLKGQLETWLENKSALEVEDLFRKTLEKERPNDAQSGGAAVGSHLSDLALGHADKNLPLSFCSMGEQKALLISMILAHVRVHSYRRKETPLLLFDEAVVHLDATRREALFSELKGLNVQTFLTGTDRSLFEDVEDDAQIFEIEEGRVIELRKD